LRLLHSTSASYAILTRPRRRLQPSAAQHGACMRSPRWNIISPAAALSRVDSGAFAHFACESAVIAPPVAARGRTVGPVPTAFAVRRRRSFSLRCSTSSAAFG